ncbi:acyltransferase family protein [Arthrobacter cupressi]|uniref:Peptidoglycan/LPS O-acetylase OafA/YrhL, contains acyltransferase and SGNH-hydrolase domains n=1 Tax=Arthrobacter cupressi TaxID=1045773 RepID=A0A1G8P0D6_9MICC|nr:acyltransferase family protein [Arthrobacter cupressi]NYD76687.1 peptidoglycan/LPS O-acetylase OafA/YrhL [Arthrobacter cupressi]SDI85962.1 Peptidoglycan/LPS O-acetylase OafA/YrhL, contains acyltransferase and SGNH-hydrolase domains [Arthrobacter cupressi]
MTQQSPTLAAARPAAPEPGTKFRTDIQALRALAVAAVVVNHLWPRLLPGGFVGVDVFFVISGFLITRHLVEELRGTGRVRLAVFYGRRMRRLLPAALLVAAGSLAASWIIQPYSRWLDVAWETLAAVFYGENWLLAAKSVDYSADHEMATPVQHYWSLSVEEQFYLVWPLMLAGAFLLALRLRKAPLTFLTAVMGTVFVLSLAYSVYFTVASKNEAYFVTTTRAWEFAAGGLIALATFALAGGGSAGDGAPGRGALARAARHPAARLWMGLLGGAGVAALVLSLVFFDEQTLFPGATALLPVLGTGAIVLSGSVLGRSALPAVGFRPIQGLGDISYSLYLWHWPLIVLAVPLLGHELRTREKLAIAAVSVVLAVLTKRFVEDPGRARLFRNRKPRVSILAGFGAMAVAGVLSFAMLLSAGHAEQLEQQQLALLAKSPCYGAASLGDGVSCPERYGPPNALNIGKAESPYFAVSGCRAAKDQIRVQGIAYLQDCDYSGGKKDAKTVWFIGDSHAEHWKVAFFDLARKQGWKVRLSLAGGCSLADVRRVAFMDAPRLDAQSQSKCLDWSGQVSDRIMEQRPDLVVASTFSVKETIDDGTGRDQLSQYRSSVERRIAKWGNNGTRVVMIRDTPLTLGKSTPTCVINNKGNALACATERRKALVADPTAKAVAELGHPNLKVLDLSDQFCDDARCYAVTGGLFVFFDNNHLSRSYVESLAPVFEQRLLSLARGA